MIKPDFFSPQLTAFHSVLIKPADIFAFFFQRANTFFYSPIKGSFDFSPTLVLVQLPITITQGFLEINSKCTFLIFISLFSIGVGLGAFFHFWASIFSFPLICSILELLLSLPLLYIFAFHLMFVFRYMLHPHCLKSNHCLLLLFALTNSSLIIAASIFNPSQATENP